eukprot:1255523-Amphidinium_carterae.1
MMVFGVGLRLATPLLTFFMQEASMCACVRVCGGAGMAIVPDVLCEFRLRDRSHCFKVDSLRRRQIVIHPSSSWGAAWPMSDRLNNAVDGSKLCAQKSRPFSNKDSWLQPTRGVREKSTTAI